MNHIFSTDKVNQGRQKELDFAKGLAIIFMVLVHSGEVFQRSAGYVYERVVEFFGSPPAAPIFMMALGTGIVYSRRNDANTLLKRGLKILAMGYILNVFRDFIPYTLLAVRTGDMSYKAEAWEYLWGIDILAFAGLTFIFFGIIKKLNIKQIQLFAIWCGLSTLNLLVRNISFESETANAVFGLFWGTYECSWFPFLPWIGYPILGYVFGNILIRCKDKDAFYSKLLIGTGALSIPLWVYSYINNVQFGAFGEFYQTAYYHHDLMGNLVLATFALFWLSVCYYIVKVIPEKVYNVFARWSKNINMIYCIHYTMLGWLMLVIEAEAQTPIVVMLIATCVFIATDLICCAVNAYSKKAKQNLEVKTIEIA